MLSYNKPEGAVRTAAIMQPTYFPWMGYFDLMDQSDVFVLLDSVQFDKRSWQQRNKIKSPHGELLLTIPVQSKGKFTQKICEVQIASLDIYETHLKAIEYNYRKAEFYNTYIEELREIFLRKDPMLTDFTIALIAWLKEKFGIQTPLIRSSVLEVNNRKADLLVEICKKIEADRYISPLGSKVYIQEGEVFKKNQIELLYNNYTHPRYKQLFGEFVPYLSAIDLLFNEGNRALSIIRSGRNIYAEIAH